MELNITEFFNEAAPRDYSASVAEIGNNAGADTWQAAMADADDYNLLDTDDKRDAFRVYVKGFGAWDDAEIAAWCDTELQALCVQMIAGDMRECGIGPESTDADWGEYQKRAEAGRVSGRIGRNETDIFYYIGD